MPLVNSQDFSKWIPKSFFEFTFFKNTSEYNIRKNYCLDRMANQNQIWLAISEIAWSLDRGVVLMCKAQAF